MVQAFTEVVYRENLSRSNAHDKKVFDKIDKDKDGILQREEIINTRKKEVQWKRTGNIALTFGGTVLAGVGLGAATVLTGGAALLGAGAAVAGLGATGFGMIFSHSSELQEELNDLEQMEKGNEPAEYHTGIWIEI